MYLNNFQGDLTDISAKKWNTGGDSAVAGQKVKGPTATSSDLYFLGLLNVTPEYHVYGCVLDVHYDLYV